MNMYIPFICLALGAAINWKVLPQPVLKAFDMLMNIALMVLMVIIGINIGASEKVMSNLGSIGLNCLIISVAAIWCAVLMVVICEKTVMPLEKIRQQVAAEAKGKLEGVFPAEASGEGKSGLSPLVIIMPGFIAAGVLIGWLLLSGHDIGWVDTTLTISLIFLYTSAGVSLASSKSVFGYIRKLGLRVLWMPVATFAGCLLGGLVSGLVLGVPLDWAVLSASGMGYYSLTGAFMTENFGVEAGTYGFVVNVLRDVLTVLFLPLLIKVSKGSPIASGAGGCMDSMLIPVSRFVGPELTLVALISGTIITIAVPIWLPIGAGLLG